MAARGAAIDAIFMLQAHQIVAVEVEEIGGPLIGGNVFLGQLQAHLFRIVVARIGIVDGNRKQASLSVFCCQRSAQVGGESGNAALPRQIVSDKSNARGQRQAAGFQFDRQRGGCASSNSLSVGAVDFKKRHPVLLSHSNSAKRKKTDKNERISPTLST